MKRFILLNFCFVVMCAFSVKAQYTYTANSGSIIEQVGVAQMDGSGNVAYYVSTYTISVAGVSFIDLSIKNIVLLGPETGYVGAEYSYTLGEDEGIEAIEMINGVFDANGNFDGDWLWDSYHPKDYPNGFNIRSTGNVVTIQVLSNKEHPVRRGSSWEISYQANTLSPPTSQQYTFTNVTGTFDDGSGDSEYVNNFSGSYLVKPAGASKVTLNFSSFDVGSVYNGIVRVYDGENASATLMGTYTKDNAPVASLNSTSNAMFITFITDNTPGASGTTHSQGWAVNYSAVTNGAWDKIGSNLYYNSGNIGLGNTNATEKLTVTGNIAATGGLTANTITATDAISAAKISATRTISASNINATEAITASAFGTTGTMSAKRFVASEMITSPSLMVSGLVSTGNLNATGSISAPTVNASTLLKAPTIEATTILKTPNATVTGTVSAANVSATTGITTPTLTAMGIITANAFKGDGSQLTGLSFNQSDLYLSGSNSWRFHTPDDGRTSLYFAPLTDGTWDWDKQIRFENTGNIFASGSVTATNLIGDGSQLTGITASQISGNIPSTQISGMIPSTQISGLNQGDFTGNVTVPVSKSLKFGDRNNTSFGYLDIGVASCCYNTYASFRGNLYFGNDGQWNAPLTLQSNGTVVIYGGEHYDNSVQDTQGARLMVNGAILCEKIKVIADVPSSDYVFEKDYKLKSLEEVEAFVKTNKHLEGVPSAEEFKKDGYSIGDMDNMLLKKIEEMTLLMIEQNKKNEMLTKKVEQLEKALENVKNNSLK